MTYVKIKSNPNSVETWKKQLDNHKFIAHKIHISRWNENNCNVMPNAAFPA